MVNLAIEETSGVDHPAHLHEGWLVMKSASESEVQRVLDKSLTKEDSNMENKTTEATEDKVEKTVEEELASAKSRIAELEAKLAEKEMKKPEEEVAMAMNEDDEKKKAMYGDSEEPKEKMMDEDDKDKFMKSAPTSVVKMITDLKKQAEEATAELRKEREARADALSVEKAKGWANLNLDAEKVGPALRRLSESDAELAKSVEELLSSVNAQAESASIFAEIGKSADFKSGNAYERITTLAKSAVEEGVSKSMAQAIADVATKNPDLYTQYLSEKGAN